MRNLAKMEREVDERRRKDLAERVNMARKLFPAEVITQIERKAAKDVTMHGYQQPQVELLRDVYDHAYLNALNGSDR